MHCEVATFVKYVIFFIFLLYFEKRDDSENKILKIESFEFLNKHLLFDMLLF